MQTVPCIYYHVSGVSGKQGLFTRLQSAYWRFHSTDTSVLKLACDALLAAHHGDITLLGLLDLSSYQQLSILLTTASLLAASSRRLVFLAQSSAGSHPSSVSNRTLTVHFAGQQSTIADILCGMPQGSVLGQVLFLLYTADVTVIAQRHGFLAHFYADDTQLYFHDKALSEAIRLLRLKECMGEIDNCISSNHLWLNADKTHFYRASAYCCWRAILI